MDKLSNLSYEEGWKDADVPVYNDKPEPEPEQPPKRKGSRPVVIILQTVLCALIVLAAFALKLFGGELYQNISAWYHTELNDGITLSSDFTGFKLDKGFAEAED